MGTRTEQMIGGRIVAWSDHLFLAWAVAGHVRVAQRGLSQDSSRNCDRGR